ncbi:MAG: hypothetical protein A2315_13565 [Ignavibacteria bacterium RIFOXYB2_FULL_35_12]|nr:MAG: hypothetical protein A2X60_03495 [Ignavibacteria bacterium GWF2_35_20]OGU78660.1 MAG: hypothetical protein A2254_00595 [Ignavibacteria bacterium RIFOXYA2_FULL_35_9]OGU87327.1 MAG: hypothetical protein A2492_00440 [Ignavibacteria bacterium RIFOXYC12_FULL_35_11]OGU89795.1 MAG: hypothetical protein A3K31_13135 [Ignavibacteria bacterium RIFOXYA12_FULL_35_25]OGU95318.1 MAG: hypothetical protein A2347_09670 [Ignavibacteria bacterium RIFOXYB12_FULL_35_14]OGV01454.1 MAG: hypothetical protein A
MKITELESHKTLREIPLFSELSIEQLREISTISTIKKFAKHEFIFSEGDYYQGFFILLKGTVKIFKVTSEGKESVVHIVKPFTAFADIPLFEGRNYAGERLCSLLSMHCVWRAFESGTRYLLCFLLLWRYKMSAKAKRGNELKVSWVS